MSVTQSIVRHYLKGLVTETGPEMPKVMAFTSVTLDKPTYEP